MKKWDQCTVQNKLKTNDEPFNLKTNEKRIYTLLFMRLFFTVFTRPKRQLCMGKANLVMFWSDLQYETSFFNGE